MAMKTATDAVTSSCPCARSTPGPGRNPTLATRAIDFTKSLLVKIEGLGGREERGKHRQHARLHDATNQHGEGSADADSK